MANKTKRPAGPIAALEPHARNWSGPLTARKFEAKHIYFGWWKRYSANRIEEPCLVLWSKELEGNILVRGYEQIGRVFGQYYFGEDMPAQYVEDAMVDEGVDWLLGSLKYVLRSRHDMRYVLTGGGSHPHTPSLWFNGFEMMKCTRIQ